MSTTQRNAQNILANLEIIKAAAEGKSIETKVGDSWRPVLAGLFHKDPSKYRIKREPLVQYMVVRDDPTGKVVPISARDTRADAERGMALYKKSYPDRTYRVVEVREVVKE